MLVDGSGSLLYSNSAVRKLWAIRPVQPTNLHDVVAACVTQNSRLQGQAAITHLLNPATHGENWDVDLSVLHDAAVPVLLSVSLASRDAAIFLLVGKDVRQYKIADHLLSSEQQLYQIVFNNISDAVFLAPIDEHGMHHNFVAVNDTACTRLGYTREEMLRMNARSLNPSANLEKVKAMGRKIQREKLTLLESIHVTKNGTQIPVAVVARIIRIGDNEYVLSVASDLREVKHLQQTEARFARLLEYGWDEIFIFSSEDLTFIHANQGALNNLGFTLAELKQKRAFDLLATLDEHELRRLLEPLTSGQQNILVFESTLRRKNDTVYPVEVRLQRSHNEVPPVFLANIQDITRRKLSEQKLNFLANYDVLTELPNRALFFDRLAMAIENCKRADTLAALIFLDIDSFKSVNDTLGHAAGDELIKTVARRLSESVRRTDTVARLGGDEFTIVLTNITQMSAVELIAQKILEQASKPVEVAGQILNVTVSMGVSIFPFSETDDPYVLLKQADTAMYQAKANGKNNVQFYTESAAKEELHRVKYEQALKTSLEKNQYFIVVQPRVSLATGRPVGGEVLLRWRHPEFGLVSPLDFIPLLERSGQILNVGMWVIEQACQFIAYGGPAMRGMKVSVNVTARQLDDPNFFANVKKIMAKTGVAPFHLELEITESALLIKNDTVMTSLHQANDFGVNICLDDFGTGYSSLSYLRQFPIKVLKIDRSFITDLNSKKDNQAIIEAIIGLAKNLSLHLVAEGIESKSESELLLSMGCVEGQGYFYYKPMLPAEYFMLLKGAAGSG